MYKKLLVLVLSILISLVSSGTLRAGSSLVIDCFMPSDNGKFPKGWESKQMGEARGIYKVVLEEGNAILCAHCTSKAVSIGKKIEIDLRKYPILKWRWKVVKSPTGADERHKKTGDSAAAIYVVFPNGMKVWSPKAIKYVWSSSSMPQNSTTVSPYASNTKIVVLENRETPLGVWIEEEVNVLKDYTRFFGEKIVSAKMIGIMSDSDNTNSEVHACYDDIVLESISAEVQ